jgi:hypothetical protein
VAAGCEAAQAKSKRVTLVPDVEIQRVRVLFRMQANELWIVRDTEPVAPKGYRSVRRGAPSVTRLTIFPREHSEPVANLVAERFGARFELATTRVYAWTHRLAPALTR